jgi:putative sterol carrier protein
MSNTVQATLESLRARFRPSVIDREIVYYLSLGDDPDDKWTVTLAPTACSMVKGRAGNADCVLKMRKDLFARLLDGSFKPGALDFVTGKIKTNDLNLLVRLRQAFDM